MGWADTHIDALKRGERVTFRPRGASMKPHIPERALVEVAPLEGPVEPGDIVLCRVRGATYLHFASAIHEDSVRIENARGFVNGWTSTTKIFGVVVSVDGKARPRGAHA